MYLQPLLLSCDRPWVLMRVNGEFERERLRVVWALLPPAGQDRVSASAVMRRALRRRSRHPARNLDCFRSLPRKRALNELTRFVWFLSDGGYCHSHDAFAARSPKAATAPQ